MFLSIMCTTLVRVVYTREELLALSRTGHGVKHQIPTELRRPYRGYRAGAKLKAKMNNRKWRYKPFLPSVLMRNVNSLQNKCAELEVLVRNQWLYMECSLICLSESWLNDITNPASQLCEETETRG